MSDPTLTSPNTGNYYVGKGIVTFQVAGEPDPRDLGDVPEFEVTLDISTLDHFTSRSGIRSKDLIIVIERSGTARWVMHEWTPANLALWGMGSVDELGSEGPTFDILSEDAIEGRLIFTGTNSVGPNWNLDLHRVRVTPSSSINMIQENDWGGVEVTGELLLSESTGKFGTATLKNLPSET